ncbi:MAG: M23 family metallopeptidase [Bacteroidota bacterium]|nr:M23 family metallopeptidase [Bacteroidota bacterium]
MTIKKFYFSILILINSLQYSPAQNKPVPNICEKWNQLDRQIVNQSIDVDEAIELMSEYEPQIKKYFKQKSGSVVNRYDWVFPLDNTTSFYFRDNGNDYRAAGYDYFQGSNTKGHPAHDIMILDKNKDLMDDSTLKPVDVVSMSGGLIVATDTTWEAGSVLRGGKYVKVFDVTNNGIFYYSHLSLVTVRPGDIVSSGDKIGEVGRTGRKAILPAGKTHLHIAFLKSVEGYPKPEDIHRELIDAEKKYMTNK